MAKKETSFIALFVHLHNTVGSFEVLLSSIRMRLISYVEVEGFESEYTCSRDVSKSINIQQIRVFDKK